MTADAEQIELRSAALSMREQHPMSHPRHEMWFTLAEWLEGVAMLPDYMRGSEFESALKVARAYNSAIERPDITSDL